MVVEFEELILEDLGRIITGKTPSTKKEEYFGHGYPFFTPRDMDGSRFLESTERSITQKGVDSVKNSLLPAESILVSCIGSDMGKVAINKKNGVSNQQINSILVDRDKFNLLYIYYNLSARQKELKNLGASGSALPILNKGDFSKVPILLPPLPTQERIADILGTLDDKIELNRQMNRTLEAMARAIFKSWFMDFDPVTAKMEGRDYPLPAEVMALFPDELVESELGLIPKGWKVKPLDNIAKFMNGYAMQKYPPKEGENSLPVIKIRELRAGAPDDNSNHASLDIPEKYIIKDGDVLFSWSGSLLVTIWTGGEGALNQHLFKVSSNKYPKWFYYLWTDHHLNEFQRIAADKATTMGHIKRDHLSKALTLLPDEKVMIEGNKVLIPIIDKIIANSLESQALEKMRDIILPKLMSGKMEV